MVRVVGASERSSCRGSSSRGRSATVRLAVAIVAIAAFAGPGSALARESPAHSRMPKHVRVRGTGPPVIPLFPGELGGPLRDYRQYVARLLGALQAQVTSLAADLHAGNAAAAESEWLAAHLTWLQIGQDDGAYGAFGDLGRRIDGTSAGLLDGTADPSFTGFHKVEFDIWTRGDLGAAANDADRLVSLVTVLARRGLAAELPGTKLGLSNWVLRPHEILEDALRDSLSGNDDYGSGTDLASVTADVAATRELLALLAPALLIRAPHLGATARRELSAVIGAINATRANGSWPAVTALTLSQRERVNSAIGAALETLARVPDRLQVGGDL
jgi:iron uptake system EfeUOB component EfeO/EfeM